METEAANPGPCPAAECSRRVSYRYEAGVPVYDQTCPDHRAAPCAAPAGELVSVCLEAHNLIVARERLYGPMSSSWEEVAELAEQLAAPSDSPGQRAVLVLVAAKLVRRKHSPENLDHARDACGYLGILARMEQDHDSLRTLGDPT